MNEWTFTHKRVQKDELALQAGSILAGVIVRAAAGNATTVALYDGQSANDEWLDTIEAGAGNTERVIYAEPIMLLRGLYVDLDTNTDLVQLICIPKR